MANALKIPNLHIEFFQFSLAFILFLSLLFLMQPSVAQTTCERLMDTPDPESKMYSDLDLSLCRNHIFEQASKGNISALILQSQIALKGIGQKKSRRNAGKILQRASKVSSPVAKRLLADLFVSKLGANKEEYLKAELLYREAIEKGDVLSVTKLALLYSADKIAGKSADDAAALFEKAGDENPTALLERAKIVLAKSDHENSIRSASDLLEKAANAKNPEAMFLFSVLNLNNDGYSNAALSSLHAMMCNSAELGYPPAMLECAKWNLKNSNVKAAEVLLEKGAAAGHVESIDYLAKRYSQTGSSRDLQKAKDLWFKAATLGSDAAKLELIYRKDTLPRPELLRLNGAFSHPDAFNTDIGRIMVGNHYLSIVDRGRSGTYIKGEYWYYTSAMSAFSAVARSSNKVLAEQAAKVSGALRSQKSDYEKDLEARRQARDVRFWVGVAAVTVGILALAGNNSKNQQSSTSSYDPCAGINGLAWYGVSAGAIALGGCNPYSFK